MAASFTNAQIEADLKRMLFSQDQQKAPETTGKKRQRQRKKSKGSGENNTADQRETQDGCQKSDTRDVCNEISESAKSFQHNSPQRRKQNNSKSGKQQQQQNPHQTTPRKLEATQGQALNFQGSPAGGRAVPSLLNLDLKDPRCGNQSGAGQSNNTNRTKSSNSTAGRSSEQTNRQTGPGANDNLGRGGQQCETGVLLVSKNRKKSKRKKLLKQISGLNSGQYVPVHSMHSGGQSSAQSDQAGGVKKKTKHNETEKSKKSSDENKKAAAKTQKDTSACSAGVLENSGEDRTPDRELKLLEAEHIFPLKKKSGRFPNAKFYCRLCEYHCDTVPICMRHVKDTRHKRLKQISKGDILLRNLPSPCEAHVKAVDKLLKQVYEDNRIGEEHLEQRLSAFEKLKTLMNGKLTGVKWSLFGSSLNGFGLKNSDVNIDLTILDSQNPALVLTSVYEILKSTDLFTDVRSDFSAKVPAVLFTALPGDLKCEIGVNNEKSLKTCMLMNTYARTDPRVAQLGVCFRYWARLCSIDEQDRGTLPSYCFPMMTIFFLQQTKPPVLPVLHQLVSKTEKDENAYFSDLDNMGLWWKCRNHKSLGQLWVEMLRFYSIVFDLNSHVISIRSTKPVTREEKKWASKRMAVEDPFSLKRNVARSLSHSQIFEYIYDRLRAAYLYFGIPQTQSGSIKINPSNPVAGNPSVQNVVEGVSSTGSLVIHKIGSLPVKVVADLSGKLSTSGVFDSLFNYSVKKFSDELNQIDSLSQNPANSSCTHSHNEVKVREMQDYKNSEQRIDCSTDGDDSELQTEKAASSSTEPSLCSAFSELNISPEGQECEDGDIQNRLVTSYFLDEVLAELLAEVLSSSCVNLSIDNGTAGSSQPPEGTAGHTASGDNESGDKISVTMDGVSVTTETEGAGILKSEVTDGTQIDIDCEVAKVVEDVIRAVISEDDNVVHLGMEEKTTSDVAMGQDILEKNEEVPVLLQFEQKKQGEGSAVVMETKQQAGLANEAGSEEEDVIVDDSTDEEDEDGADDDEEEEEEEEDADDDPTDDEDKQKDIEKPSGNETGSVVENLCEEDFIFKFDLGTLTDNKGPAIMCSICQAEGHLKNNCPTERLPDLCPLPSLSPSYKKILNHILLQVPNDFEPSYAEKEERRMIIRELQYFIREIYSDAVLSIFGSSCNGFGFQHSDLDICMTFASKPTPEGLDCVEIIETLGKKLRAHRGLYNVIPITTAKVPIVKFFHRRSQLEADISLYNTLAQYNTEMLLQYSEIDYRVKVIGYALKVFAKLCDIGDASRGSLSSYAYILMALYFLQQREPPVIPVLQELYEGEKPVVEVDGWNAWFYRDRRPLSQVWSGWDKNKETVAELWVGLMKFYTEEFNFNDHVICIRQHRRLTRFEKMWNGKCISIEDPFDLGHNLGAGLSRKMNTFIRKAFINGRELYGKSINSLPQAYSSWQDYLFDPHLLTEGHPPNDRGCRACGKIGHFAKECPRVLARKEREQKERERREKKQEQDGDQSSERKNHHGNKQVERNNDRYGNRERRDSEKRNYHQNERERRNSDRESRSYQSDRDSRESGRDGRTFYSHERGNRIIYSSDLERRDYDRENVNIYHGHRERQDSGNYQGYRDRNESDSYHGYERQNSGGYHGNRERREGDRDGYSTPSAPWPIPQYTRSSQHSHEMGGTPPSLGQAMRSHSPHSFRTATASPPRGSPHSGAGMVTRGQVSGSTIHSTEILTKGNQSAVPVMDLNKAQYHQSAPVISQHAPVIPSSSVHYAFPSIGSPPQPAFSSQLAFPHPGHGTNYQHHVPVISSSPPMIFTTGAKHLSSSPLKQSGNANPQPQQGTTSIDLAQLFSTALQQQQQLMGPLPRASSTQNNMATNNYFSSQQMAAPGPPPNQHSVSQFYSSPTQQQQQHQLPLSLGFPQQQQVLPFCFGQSPPSMLPGMHQTIPTIPAANTLNSPSGVRLQAQTSNTRHPGSAERGQSQAPYDIPATYHGHQPLQEANHMGQIPSALERFNKSQPVTVPGPTSQNQFGVNEPSHIVTVPGPTSQNRFGVNEPSHIVTVPGPTSQNQFGVPEPSHMDPRMTHPQRQPFNN